MGRGKDGLGSSIRDTTWRLSKLGWCSPDFVGSLVRPSLVSCGALGTLFRAHRVLSVTPGTLFRPHRVSSVTLGTLTRPNFTAGGRFSSLAT